MERNGTSQRIYGLDILRTAAICYVMISHGRVYSQCIIPTEYYKWLLLDGVGLFFVLSGYLIGRILIKDIIGQPFTLQRLKQFWLRRWLRTLPAYYLVLCLLVVLYYISHHGLPPRLWQYYTFTQNFAWAHPLFFGEAWSLSIEEWFYILIPAGLLLLLKFAGRNKRTIIAYIVFVIVLGTAIRSGKAILNDYTRNVTFILEITQQFITRIDCIMYGMLGAWLSIYKPQWWAKRKNTTFTIGLIFLFGGQVAQLNSAFFYIHLYYLVSAAATMLLLPKLSSMTTGKGVIYRAVTFISVISYSMYLTNQMIVQRGIMSRLLRLLHLSEENGMAYGMITLVLFWGLTITVSYLLYNYWERPMMQLRERFK